MKFKREFLLDTLGDKDIDVENVITGQSRWSTTHRRVFKHEGRFYQSFYSKGSTEQQDEGPYEYEDDEIECKEVMPVQKTVTVYEEKK